jgi:hypothetical protein
MKTFITDPKELQRIVICKRHISKKESKVVRLKGGKGSGHFGHRGIPGHQGGALPDNKQGISIPYKPDESAVRSARKAAELEITELIEDPSRKTLALKELEALPKFIADSKIRIRISVEDALKVLEDGRFKSQFETGDSKGRFDPEGRRQAEADGLGVPEDLDDSQRPIYGYLFHDELPQDSTVKNYGNVVICLKDDVKARTTATLGDSLGGFEDSTTVGTPMLDFRNESMNYQFAQYLDAKYFHRSSAYQYTEAQIHGGITLSDIDHVEFDGARFYPDLISLSEFTDAFEGKGISVKLDTEGTFVSKKELKVVRLKGGEGSGHRGHKGIPGHRGGSLPDETSSPSVTEISKSDMTAGVVNGDNISGRDFAREVGKTIAKNWNPSYKTLSILNAEEKTGNLSKEQIAGMYLAQWTGSSGGPIANVMIDAAAKSHDIKLQHSIIDDNVNKWMNDNPTVKKDMQDLGNIIYENTQTWFKDKGISKVILYRKGTVKDSEKSVTSWSTEYGAFISTDESRISLEANIPVKYIFSLANTGFGNIEEREAVVMGDVSEFVRKSGTDISKEHSGVIICFDCKDTKIWTKFDNEDNAHITLLFMGDAENVNKEDTISKLKAFANSHGPVSGAFNGQGAFADLGDGYPIVALFDSPVLPWFRTELVDLFPNYPQNHGFTPHMTLEYIKDLSTVTLGQLPFPIDHTFTSISLWIGGEHIEFPLNTSMNIVKEFHIKNKEEIVVRRFNVPDYYDISKQLEEFDAKSREDDSLQKMIIIDDDFIVQTFIKKEVGEAIDISNIYGQMFVKSNEYFTQVNGTVPTIKEHNEMMKTINAAISKVLGIAYKAG